MTTALIVLNYNDEKTTSEYLREVGSYRAYDHIVVVDNASTDNSYEGLKKLENEHTHVITTGVNGGYAKGNNYGAAYAIEHFSPDILFFSNPDVHYPENVVDKLIADLTEDSEVAIAAAITDRGTSVWSLPGFWGTMRQILLVSFTLHKKALRKKLIAANKPEYVGVVEGSFFGFRRSAYDEIGGFDERTFLYLEENIASFRLKEKGYKVLADPTVTYVHEHSKSIKKAYKTKVGAFKLFKPSFLTYLDYVGMNPVRNIIFEIVFALGYVERAVYTLVKR